jgi:hypothetical protein
MKKLTILTAVLALFATLSLQAADDAKPKRNRQVPKELLEKYDKNKDGKVDKNDNLSKEEMKSFREELKKSRDAAK